RPQPRHGRRASRRKRRRHRRAARGGPTLRSPLAGASRCPAAGLARRQLWRGNPGRGRVRALRPGHAHPPGARLVRSLRDLSAHDGSPHGAGRPAACALARVPAGPARRVQLRRCDRARPWLRAGIDRLVFRRSRRRWAEAYAFLHTLSPELGVLECCRRTLAELARALQLRGAALLFASGESVTHGALALGPLAAAWPRWAGVLPRHTIGKSRFRDLPLPLI